jgi:rubrerythrin
MDAKTLKDLKDAFAGESQANRRYLAFSKKAAEENFPGVALLFKAIAEAETVHALRHFNLYSLASTLENLKEAAKGENYEVTTMYPGFIKDAAKEKAASMSFNGAIAAEKEHEKMYLDAILKVSENEDIDIQKVSVCPVCGYTVIGDAPDECPVCKAKQEVFMEFT